MNVRRGVLRFSIAFLMLWGGFWTWTYFDAGKKSTEAAETMWFYHNWRLRDFDYEPRGGVALKNYRFLTEEADRAMARSDAELGRQESAFNYGVWGMAAYLVLLVAAGWIWAGFRIAPSPIPSARSKRRGEEAPNLARGSPELQVIDRVGDHHVGETEPKPEIISQTSDAKAPSAPPDQTHTNLEVDFTAAGSGAFDGKRMRTTLYWGVTLATGAEFVLRSALSGGEDRGTNVLIIALIGVVAWLMGRQRRSEKAGAWLFGIVSIGFLGLSLSRYF